MIGMPLEVPVPRKVSSGIGAGSAGAGRGDRSWLLYTPDRSAAATDALAGHASFWLNRPRPIDAPDAFVIGYTQRPKDHPRAGGDSPETKPRREKEVMPMDSHGQMGITAEVVRA